MTKICEACKVFESEVLTPVGAGAHDLCWLCAHYVTKHNMPIGHVPQDLQCGCGKTDVYPKHVLERRALQAKHQAPGVHSMSRAAQRYADRMDEAKHALAKRAALRITR